MRLASSPDSDTKPDIPGTPGRSSGQPLLLPRPPTEPEADLQFSKPGRVPPRTVLVRRGIGQRGVSGHTTVLPGFFAGQYTAGPPTTERKPTMAVAQRSGCRYPYHRGASAGDQGDHPHAADLASRPSSPVASARFPPREISSLVRRFRPGSGPAWLARLPRPGPPEADCASSGRPPGRHGSRPRGDHPRCARG